ncbi:hypothetical protein [Devosia sp. 2618]|uniref:hypothetical protein n=1 Tax=Devosia sp. 2618 TaxID=3156454 RepID=UPI0033953FC1
MGTWHIVRTTLGLWRKRRAAALNYLPLPTGEVADVVTWQGKNGPGMVVGIDRALPEGGWEWRGVEPLTLIARSRWSFVTADAAAGWAAIKFERTLFTEAGVDILSREQSPDAAMLDVALAAMGTNPDLAAYRDKLFVPGEG